MIGDRHPTLKRGAIGRCAYGAGDWLLPIPNLSTNAPLGVTKRNASGFAEGYLLFENI
jgi:hypothetical protein